MKLFKFFGKKKNKKSKDLYFNHSSDEIGAILCDDMSIQRLVDSDPFVKDSIKRVDAALDILFPQVGWGDCFKIWDFKKSLLRDCYNIDWLSPHDLHPFSKIY